MDYYNYGIDLDKYKPMIKNTKAATTAADATQTITGTFRKLNVD